jgi:diguanylate cyclase (GGDEF)-like protein
VRAAFHARMLLATAAAGALLITGSWASADAAALPDLAAPAPPVHVPDVSTPAPTVPKLPDVAAQPPTVPDVSVVSDVVSKPPPPATTPAAAGATPKAPATPPTSGQGSGGGGAPSGGSGAATAPPRRAAPTTRARTGSAARVHARPARPAPPARSTRPRRSAVAKLRARGASRTVATAGRAARSKPTPPATASVKRAARTKARPPDIFTRIVEVIPPWVKVLIGVLVTLVVGLAVGAHRRLRRQAADHRHQALHDQLTELSNRRLFHQRVADALAVAEREAGCVAVLLVDLDGFKEVNDTLGHTNGDRLLQQVASRLTEVVPSADTVARLGGDEFAVLVPAVAGDEAAVAIGEALRDALREPFTLQGIPVLTDASVGIAIGPRQGDDPDTLIKHADVAMYIAKEGPGGTVVYAPERDHYSPERLALVAELRRAIELDELLLHYQPQIEPETGRVGGVEALLRWHHPERGLVPPDQFVPLAERTGLIRPLTLWVMEAAMRQCAAWRRAGLDLPVAANLSASNLADADLPDAIERLLRRWAVPPGFLRLEITETAAMADPARTGAVLERLDAMGVELAIDDFGTGHSSLAHLRRLPVHELKIDRSFVATMATDRHDAVIVAATIDLGHNLGLRVVAEGVEDEETLRELTGRGCDLAQGYLFSKPLPAEELESWLRAWARSGVRDERDAAQAAGPGSAVVLRAGAWSPSAPQGWSVRSRAGWHADNRSRIVPARPALRCRR